MAENKGIPDDVLKELVKDPDFQKLDENAQDRVLTRFAQESYGVMPHYENVFQKAGRVSQDAFREASQNISNPATAPLTPISMMDAISNPLINATRLGVSAAGIPEENLSPMIGQGVGGSAGGYLGAVGGEGLGEALRQGGKFARGQKLTPQDIPTGMGITAVGEGVPRAIFNTYFGRQIATQSMNKLGQAIGAVKNALASDSTALVPTTPILQKLKPIYDKIATPLKSGASQLEKWIGELEGNPSIHASQLDQMVQDFGYESEFSTVKGGAKQFAKDTVHPVINQANKEAQSVASSAYDDLATSKGFKDMPTIKDKWGKMRKRWGDINPAAEKTSFIGKLGVAELAREHFGLPVAVLTYLAENAITSPILRGVAFNAINNPLVSAALSSGRLAGTELVRDVTRKK